MVLLYLFSDISQVNWKQLVDLSENVSTAVNNFTNYYQRSSRNKLHYELFRTSAFYALYVS